MTRITETFTYADLNNGYLTPDEDVIVRGTVTVNKPNISYKLVDQSEEHTAKLGKGCYRRLYFPAPFEGEITIGYETYNSTRNDLDQDRLEIEDQTLSYRKVPNKSSVVPDGIRDNIDFRQVSDVEPLLARYLMLQQFTGARLTSKYVINRAMDDYFENYWEEDKINVQAGAIEPNIPWLRMNNITGDTIKYGPEGLYTIIDGVESRLYPLDSIADESYDRVMKLSTTLTPKDSMQLVVDNINKWYRPDAYDSNLVLGKTFFVEDGTLSVDVAGTMYEMDWANRLQSLTEDAERTLRAAQELSGPFIDTSKYNELTSLIANTLTAGKTACRITLDAENGHRITIDNDDIQFIGNKDIKMLEGKLDDAEDYHVAADYHDAIDLARKLDSIASLTANKQMFNKVSSDPDHLLDLLGA